MDDPVFRGAITLRIAAITQRMAETASVDISRTTAAGI
jgi:hypothetical protein